MKLIFHGAAKEVGRSCIELQTGGDRYLLDAGIKFKENGFEYPKNIMNLPDIDGLFISHAHLDHTGSLPMFEHNNIICPIFCTKLTYALTKILLKDSYKIARIKNLHPAYNKIDLKKVEKGVRFLRYDQEYKHRELKVTFKNAGHIPGSAMMEIVAEGKKIVYTGDTKLNTTELVKGANTDYKNVDALIIESTYGSREMTKREDVTKRFIEKINDTIKKGGSVLIPVFALGRAQDILVIFAQNKFNVPIYYDGMCKKITKKILESDDPYINNKPLLEKAVKNIIIPISSQKRRESALRKQGIFVTTSGMLQGGPVISYLKEMWHESKNAILLTGYQCKRTNGRTLLEEGFIYIDGWKTQVHCSVDKFDFSGHADSASLKEIITRINPKTLILQHGDPEEIKSLKEWAEKKGTYKVIAPEIGEEIEI
jgi:putative mRNA 3-end processing factor